MTFKRTGRSGRSLNAISYGIDEEQKHKKGINPTDKINRSLLNSRDFDLRIRSARAITVEGNNCNPYNPEKDFARVRKNWGKNDRVNQCGTYILAANDQTWDELGNYLAKRDYDGNISKVKEIDKYREWGRMSLELGEAIAGNWGTNPDDRHNFQKRLEDGKKYGQVAVQTHADENGKHAHIEVNSIHLKTGKKMNYDHDDLIDMYNFADRLYRSRGLSIQQAGLERVKNPDTGKIITQRKGGYDGKSLGNMPEQLVRTGRYSYVDDINLQFELALADPEIKTKKDAIQRLKKNNIQIDQWSDNRKFIKAHIIAMQTDVKSHGKITQKKGEPSKSIRIKAYTREQADYELSLDPKDRQFTRDLLNNRLEKYEKAEKHLPVNVKFKIGRVEPQINRVKQAIQQSEQPVIHTPTVKQKIEKQKSEQKHKQIQQQQADFEASKAHNYAKKVQKQLDEEKKGTKKGKDLTNFKKMWGLYQQSQQEWDDM